MGPPATGKGDTLLFFFLIEATHFIYHGTKRTLNLVRITAAAKSECFMFPTVGTKHACVPFINPTRFRIQASGFRLQALGYEVYVLFLEVYFPPTGGHGTDLGPLSKFV